MVLWGTASYLCSTAQSADALIAYRVLLGIGMGMEFPVAQTLLSEFVPAAKRGRLIALMDGFWPLGFITAGIVSYFVLPLFGWRTVFALLALPAVFVLVVRRLVPESPRWLASRGRLDDAGRALHVFESSVKGPLPPVAHASEFDALVRSHPKRRMIDLFGPAYLKRTLAVATLWATCGFIQYGLSTWLPTIYKDFYHAPLQLALNLAVIGSVMGVVGSLVSALAVDAVGRKPVIVWSFVLCALSLVFAGIYHASSVYVVATFCSFALGLMASGFITSYVYTPEQYPTSIRAAGCGLGSAWLKLASFVAPMVVPHAIVGGDLSPAFYLLAAVPLIAALTVHFVGIETKGQVLEKLEA